MEQLIEFASRQWCRFMMPRPDLPRSLPLAKKLGRLDPWLEKLHARGAFNGCVLIARDGEVVFQGHYGFADVEQRVPLSERSSFNLASVSKHFTAMGIMLLAHDGTLSVDDSLSDHVPWLSFYGPITIRQLLHHTSGLPDYMELAEQLWDEDETLTTADMIALFVEHRPPLEFPPGEEFEYSNTGYVLLAEIVSRASGRPFPDFMNERIFKPLGMKNSAAFNRLSDENALPSRVYGFRRRFGLFGKRVAYDFNYLDGVFGDGGIYASARDLLRWDSALHEGALIPRKACEQAYVSGRLNDGRNTEYGFGWNIEAPGLVSHGGEWEGFSCYLERDLVSRTLLVVLANAGLAECVDEISSELEELMESMS